MYCKKIDKELLIGSIYNQEKALPLVSLGAHQCTRLFEFG